MKKILITGVNGLIGSSLARTLLAQGHNVSGIGRANQSVIPLSSYLSGDILDVDFLDHCIQTTQPGTIFHMAGCSSVRQSLVAPREALAVNVSGTINVLDAVRKSGLRSRVVIASSAEVYGQSEKALFETSQLDPKSTYAVSKKVAEEIGLMYNRLYDVPTLVARFFYSIGTNLSSSRMPPTIPSGYAYRLAQMEHTGTTEPLRVGLSSNAKDFIDLRDIVDANIALAERGIAGDIYNVCTGSTHSFEEIIATLKKLSTADVPIIFDDSFVRPFEPSFILGSHAKITQDTGWQPRYDIVNDTLPNVLDFWRKYFRTKLKNNEL